MDLVATFETLLNLAVFLETARDRDRAGGRAREALAIIDALGLFPQVPSPSTTYKRPCLSGPCAGLYSAFVSPRSGWFILSSGPVVSPILTPFSPAPPPPTQTSEEVSPASHQFPALDGHIRRVADEAHIAAVECAKSLYVQVRGPLSMYTRPLDRPLVAP